MPALQTDIGQRDKLFNLVEARELLPLVQVITNKHHEELSPIRLRLEKMLSNDPRRASVEQQYEQVVSRWRDKIELLGARVSGLWVVEFNVGEGCLSWRYPELYLGSFRTHDKALSDRQNLTDYIEEFDPDWAC
ncbi:DUF2203 family protein [Arenicella xantha]|uniref:Uncharacterized protein DUF2203 n=1 Tax=Arenicella xantha TaxID=644221 RepID=A0A395JPV0_9GAMM|nr:DUF2203 family protein [Arenicella xantha]RBP52665.1 uncharacterized protein DUF2203 [Arenicella xantha]